MDPGRIRRREQPRDGAVVRAHWTERRSHVSHRAVQRRHLLKPDRADEASVELLVVDLVPKTLDSRRRVEDLFFDGVEPEAPRDASRAVADRRLGHVDARGADEGLEALHQNVA